QLEVEDRGPTSSRTLESRPAGEWRVGGRGKIWDLLRTRVAQPMGRGRRAPAGPTCPRAGRLPRHRLRTGGRAHFLKEYSPCLASEVFSPPPAPTASGSDRCSAPAPPGSRFPPASKEQD